MQREHVGFITLGGLILMAIAAEVSTSVTIDCGTGCGITAPKEPYFIFSGLLIGAFAVGFPQIEPVLKGHRRVELWRRVVASVIDFHIVVASVLALTFLGLHIVLYMSSGSWSWSNADVDVSTVRLLNIVGTLVGFILIYAYYWLPSKCGRATTGQYIMGFQIVSDSHSPRFGLRPLFGYIAVASIILWIWFDSDGATEGRYWWDRASGTRPVMVLA